MSDLIEKALRHMNDPHARYSMKDRFDHAQLFTDEIERLQAALKEAAKSLAEDEQEIERLKAALESIANNTCCEGCQEAKRVAIAALEQAQDPLCQKCNERVPVTAVAALKNMKPICVDCFYVTDADRQEQNDE